MRQHETVPIEWTPNKKIR